MGHGKQILEFHYTLEQRNFCTWEKQECPLIQIYKFLFHLWGDLGETLKPEVRL